MKIVAAIFFLFGITFWLVPLTLILAGTKYVNEIKSYETIEVEITEVLNLEWSKGRYKGKAINAPLSSIQQDTLYGLDMIHVHALGDKVEVSLGPQKKIIDKASWPPFVFLILISSAWAALLTSFFLGILTQKTYSPLLLKFGFVFFFSLSLLLFSLFRYNLSQQGHFFSHAKETVGVLVDFHYKVCEHKSGNRKGEEYPCYAKIFDYKIEDGTQYKHNSDVYSSKKNGTIGDQETIYYRADYPAQAQLMNQKMSYLVTAIPLFFGCFFLFISYKLFGGINRPK